MQKVVRCSLLVLAGVVGVSMLTGCTNWHKKYTGLEVEHKNLQGLYQNTANEKARLAAQLAQEQAMVDELQKQIAAGKKPDAATGFENTGGDVAFNAAAGTITVTLADSILFDSGKADLKSNSSLSKIISVIDQKYKGKMVDVIGHTDNQPIKKSKWKDNWELSAQRALAVTRYFIGHGLAATDVRAVGRGETSPVASNATASGRAKNRRVEIVVHLISDQAKTAAAAEETTSTAAAKAEQPK